MTRRQQRNHDLVDHLILTDHGPGDFTFKAPGLLEDFRSRGRTSLLFLAAYLAGWIGLGIMFWRPEFWHLVLVNGVFLPPSQRTRALEAGDELAIWPAVAGG